MHPHRYDYGLVRGGTKGRGGTYAVRNFMTESLFGDPLECIADERRTEGLCPRNSPHASKYTVPGGCGVEEEKEKELPIVEE